ncbi:MAG: DUF1223 domain-containing protein [Sphingobacteriales bacterium]|nr:MAG: DUF1223 domain-containing protein [Sphingobacteriales bacterium]
MRMGMKNATICAMMLFGGLLFSGLKLPDKKATVFEPFCLVELFTSQGCGSCISAEEMAYNLKNDAEKRDGNVFVLSYHIDYWNPLGWEDPFSDKKYDAYQRKYAYALGIRTVYSPQIIVNGLREVPNIDKKLLHIAVNQSLYIKPSAGFYELSATMENGKTPKVKYEISGDTAGCKINFALVSKMEITKVKAGENKGSKLKNENVVRQLISVDARSKGEISFNENALPEPGNMAIIAYIQNTKEMRILGAAKASF